MKIINNFNAGSSFGELCTGDTFVFEVKEYPVNDVFMKIPEIVTDENMHYNCVFLNTGALAYCDSNDIVIRAYAELRVS